MARQDTSEHGAHGWCLLCDHLGHQLPLAGESASFAVRRLRGFDHGGGVWHWDARQPTFAYGGVGLFGREVSSVGADLPEIHVFVVHAILAAFRDRFACATKKPPPCGEGKHPERPPWVTILFL